MKPQRETSTYDNMENYLPSLFLFKIIIPPEVFSYQESISSMKLFLRPRNSATLRIFSKNG